MKDIFKQDYKISRKDREVLRKHNSILIWFTGLSGSGKSTLANLIEQELYSLKLSTFVLDGDNIRHGLNKDLSFSSTDRSENIRRISEVAKLLTEAGVITIAAFVSPLREDRNMIKHIVGSDNFIEIYVNASLAECEKRDTKGLYKKAREGEIKNMTGISSPYEAPENPDLEINTNKETVEESIQKVKKLVISRLKYGKLYN
tara:strand:+ start:1832 stop:2437 length:606 start_codon:yes stop_codon:yes gene_type:complete